jgi:hypothetical protein
MGTQPGSRRRRERAGRGAWHAARCAAVLAAALLAAPAQSAAQDSQDATVVEPTSSAALLFGVDGQAAVDSLPIRRDFKDKPRVLYSIRLDDSIPASIVDVRATIQAAVCRATDIRGSNKDDHPCKRTRSYNFDPRVFWKVVAADSPTDTEGQELADWRSTRCRDVVHHCPIPFQVDGFAIAGAGRFVNVVAAAESGSARRGQIVAIKRDRGQLHVIQAIGPTSPSQTITSEPTSDSFPVSRGSAKATRDDLRPAVLFSQPMEVEVGDIIDVRTRVDLRIRRSRDNALLTSTQIFLTPDAADTDDPRFSTGLAAIHRAGENCPTGCSLTRLGTIRSPVAGSMHVNVVMWVQDHEYKTRGVADYDGTLEVTKRE